MTRETKIGLLVGLAFMIVIGILLQQQARNSTEPPPAQLPQVTDSVLRGVDTGSRNIAAVVPAVPIAVTPRDVMPTPQDVARSNPPITVSIGAGHVAPLEHAQTPASVAANESPASVAPSPTIIPDNTQTPNDSQATSSLQRTAEQNGEALVMINPNGDVAADHTATAVATGGKKYVAQSGDTVSRMAARFMPGGNTNANRAAIIKANASLMKNKDVVILGQTYTIPVPSATAAATAQQTTTPAVVPTETAANTTATASTGGTATSGPEIWYTVKKGDTLSKIAADQLGDANAKSAIIELNRDKIKDEDTIYENMKIKLPAKPVASAQ